MGINKNEDSKADSCTEKQIPKIEISFFYHSKNTL